MTRPTRTTPPPSPIRTDDDYPLEHWRRVQRAAFPPDWSEEMQRESAQFVAERIARSQRMIA